MRPVRGGAIIRDFARWLTGPRARWGLCTRGIQRLRYCGVDLEIPVELLTPNMRRAFTRGYYEAEEAKQILNLVERGERVLEVGSAVGFISTLVAKTGRASKIFAVEANPTLISICKLNHELNGVDVEVYNEVLGPGEGQTDFYVAQDYWASSLHPIPGAQRVVVPMRRFSDRLAQWRPTLLIVDIEGGEESLFDGVTLDSVSRVVIEVHQAVIGRNGVKKVFDRLSALDFSYDQWHSQGSVVTFTSVGRS